MTKTRRQAKLESIRKHRCGTPLRAPDLWGEFITQTAQRWFQYLLGSLFCIRLIWKTVDSCPLYTNEGWPSDWAEATFIMWRSITFLWGNSLFFSAATYAYGTAARAHCKREGPLWHDVYCTSIWYCCILRCKQGFKLYAPPCQWLRVTLAICLSAGDERRGCPGQYVLVHVFCQHAYVSVCTHVSIRATCSISTSPCTCVSPQMHG